MKNIKDFNTGSQRIQTSAPSSEAAVDYAKFVLQLGPKERADVGKDLIFLLYAYSKNVSADPTPKEVSQLAKVVNEEFGK